MTPNPRARAEGTPMRTVRFGTKAETLSRLSGLLVNADVPALRFFSVARWHAERADVLRELGAFDARRVIVRSSASREDSAFGSLAGHFISVPSVDPSDRAALGDAIDRVVASYALGGGASENDQVLVQARVVNVERAGVLLTADLDTLAPYDIISWEAGGSTDAVTSGAAGELRTLVRFRNSPAPPRDAGLRPLLALARELETRLGNVFLDIEFAFDRGGRLFLLQVRPIVTHGKPAAPSPERLGGYLAKIADKCRTLGLPHPDLVGSRSFFGVMPDWNPAEIIGIHPRQLARSLYKELVTDSIWAYQRDNYGYRNLRSFPLLISLLGHPFIDVRVSLNSFVPKSLDPRIAHKLVDFYLDELERKPENHDKVEFNVAFTCFYPGLPDRLKPLLERGFSEGEVDRIKFSLLQLTNDIIRPDRGLYQQDLGRVRHLDQRHALLINSEMSTVQKIYWLLEDCKRYGTLPFAGLARAGFVATQLLGSLVELGIFSEADHAAFMASLATVARRLGEDLAALRSGTLSREEFLRCYGHLRPGTYDIESPRYDEDFERYFQGSACSVVAHARPFVLSETQRYALEQVLMENGFTCSVDELMEFIKGGIEGREYGKFVFTRHLSDVLVLVEKLGQCAGFSRSDLAHLDIRRVLGMNAELEVEDPAQLIGDDIARNRAAYCLEQGLKLPQLITSPNDIYEFELGSAEPTFVTRKVASAAVLEERQLPCADPEGAIVFIRSADPGYDWLFNRGIAGLVTEHGGANSHMAIRAAELGIPAVIGCGPLYYARWSRTAFLSVDCANRKVLDARQAVA
jgi:phosphohistidine swiveling domain-containing protein